MKITCSDCGRENEADSTKCGCGQEFNEVRGITFTCVECKRKDMLLVGIQEAGSNASLPSMTCLKCVHRPPSPIKAKYRVKQYVAVRPANDQFGYNTEAQITKVEVFEKFVTYTVKYYGGKTERIQGSRIACATSD